MTENEAYQVQILLIKAAKPGDNIFFVSKVEIIIEKIITVEIQPKSEKGPQIIYHTASGTLHYHETAILCADEALRRYVKKQTNGH